MTNVNDEMKAYAEEAINTAKQRFGLDLDYSEQSINKIENLLGLIYWDFYHGNKDEEQKKEIFNTAKLWGSFLGEFVRFKWGGTWLEKDSDRPVSINNVEFSPIKFVLQRITNHPEYSVRNYLEKLENKIIIAPIISPQPPDLSENNNQPEAQTLTKPLKKLLSFDFRSSLTFAGIFVRLVVVLACIIGFILFQRGTSTFFGLMDLPSGSNAILPQTPTAVFGISAINTQFPTPTATNTPFPTHIIMATLPPTKTLKPDTPTPTQTLIPTRTRTPILGTYSPTPPTRYPQPTATTRPPVTATEPPPPTATEVPPPTATEPPPIVIDSCSIDPANVPVDKSVTITFVIHFSPPSPGTGFNIAFDPDISGQIGCSGVDNDGDGVAFCDGESGNLPESTTVYVTFKTAAGNCVASYSSR